MAANRQEIVGIPVDWIGMDHAVARTIEAARARRFCQIATVNLDFLVQSDHDEEVRAILRAAWMNIPDGAPVAWAGRMIGAPRTNRVAGADFVVHLVEAAAREGLRVFFLGGEDDAASVAAEKMTAKHPELEVFVFEPPAATLEEMDDAKILRHLDDAQPHILLVAFGHPKQERWISRHAAQLPMVAIGVGCTFDLIAGRRSRAPRWMQSLGLEWFYRLAHEPRRLARRYVGDARWAVRTLLPWTLSHNAASARMPRARGV